MPSVCHLTLDQQHQIIAAAQQFYAQLKTHPPALIRFDLTGGSAGQWRYRQGQEELRFNPEAFVRDWAAHFPSTIAHEVAHSVVFRIWGRVRPHGPEWQDMMAQLGYPPQRTHTTALTRRRRRVYLYRCACQTHPLGPRQHSLIQKQGYRYTCKRCQGPLQFTHEVRWR